MNFFFNLITFVFDPLQEIWEREATHRRVASLIIIVFLGSLALIELNRHGLIPQYLSHKIPTCHFYAASAAFTLVLILEVISLIFTLPCSFSKAVGKQLEILALILMRNSFKELVNFSEPITIETNIQTILHIASNGFSALIIFFILGIYYKRQSHSDKKAEGETLFKFVAAKKGVSLVILVAFAFMGFQNLIDMAIGVPRQDFFTLFYTLLIFSDILLVLISQNYFPSFNSVFRNSGFALTTLFIRLALAAPAFYNAALGIGAAVFALCIAYTVDKAS